MIVHRASFTLTRRLISLFASILLLLSSAPGRAQAPAPVRASGITNPRAPLAVPTSVRIAGPRTVTVDDTHTYTATVYPADVAYPITYTWQATDQSTWVDVAAAITSTRPHRWSTPGVKAVRVIAENADATVVDHAWVEVLPKPLPDLVVTDIWYDGLTVYYQLLNRGDAEAPAGHVVQLMVDSVEITQTFARPLAPRERLTALFSSTPSCTGTSDNVRVVADRWNVVEEMSETNNNRQETWYCDRTPPVLTVRPQIVGIAQDQATITWQTNEPTSSGVYYDSVPGQLSQKATDLTAKTVHTMTLTNLTPRTAYEFKVRSQDAGKNTVDSAIYTLETLAPATQPPTPTLALAPAPRRPGFYRLTAAISDTTNVERVEFYLNGELIGVDYGAGRPPRAGLRTPTRPAETRFTYAVGFAPKRKGYTPATFHSVQHQVQAVVVTGYSTQNVFQEMLESDEPIEVDLEILYPEDGDHVGVDEPTTMTVTLFATQYPWQCTWGSGGDGMDCGNVADDVALLEVYLDDSLLGTVDPAQHQEFQYSIPIPVSPAEAGEHTLRVTAHADDGEFETVEHDFTLVYTAPELDVRRGVNRNGTHFEVVLTVSNDPGAVDTASVCSMTDSFEGFQAMAAETQHYDVRSRYRATKAGMVDIDFKGEHDCIHLTPGSEFEVTYQLVPVLYEGFVERRIGQDDVRVRMLDRTTDEVFDLASLLMTGWSSDAIGDADYILVTNPQQLASHAWGQGDPQEVLSAMAHLAVARDGVLGYLETAGDPTVLDDLVSYYGLWAGQLHPDFRVPSLGYMLIVGESEVVPAWERPFAPDLSVGLSDQPYSDRIWPQVGTFANTQLPSLIVGRIVGDNCLRLQQPLEASIAIAEGQTGHSFNRSEAMLYSGIAADYFMDNIIDLGQTLAPLDYGTVHLAHERPYVLSTTIALDELDTRDRLAAGRLYDYGRDYIVFASIDNRHVSVYDPDGQLVPSAGFDFVTFQDGDQLTLGDMDDDGEDEIIIGADMHGRIWVFETGASSSDVFEVGFDSYDGLAAGDVDGDGQDEIVWASVGDTDNLHVYDGNGVEEHTFSAPFEPYGGLAVGETVAGLAERIMVARPGSGDDKGNVSVYRVSGGSLDHMRTYTAFFRAGGALATGNVVPAWPGEPQPGADELLMVSDRASESKYDWVFVRNDYGDQVIGALPVFVEAHLGAAAGDIDGDGFDDIIVTDASSDRIEILDTHFGDTMYADAMEPVLPGTDLVVYRGHGSHTSMGVLNTNRHLSPGIDFGSAHPVILGPTCLSGNYKPNNATGLGMVEAMFGSGAAVHIGATAVSFPDPNIDGVFYFTENWETDEDVGRTFLFTEWEILNLHGSEYWTWEYNLYGDPKYGVVAPAARRVLDAEAAAPLAAAGLVTAHVPAFEVTVNDLGFDEVTLPGGGKIDTPGEYRTLIWPVELTFPAGTRVADVTLVSRGGEVLTSGLNLTRTSFATDGFAGGWLPAAAPADEDPTDYVPDPEQVFDWIARQNADGSSDLLIRIYPFYFSPATTNIKFYQDYTFNVETVSDTVHIERLATDRPVYTQSLPVSVTLVISNGAAAQDVLVAAEVQDSDGAPLEGLLLRNLHGLVGEAAFAFAWETGSAAPGDYYIAVTLKNDEGQILDRLKTPLRLGVRQMAVDLATSATQVKPGASVAISLTYANAGSVPLTGTLIVELQPPGKITPTAQVSHAFHGLAPSAGGLLTNTWQTDAAHEGLFTLIGYAAYDSKATTADPLAVDVRERRVYLPLLLRE